MNVDALLKEIDQIARKKNSNCFGLPIDERDHPVELAALREAVSRFVEEMKREMTNGRGTATHAAGVPDTGILGRQFRRDSDAAEQIGRQVADAALPSTPQKCPTCGSRIKIYNHNAIRCANPWHHAVLSAQREAEGESHDEDCPCYGDTMEHSKDCKNCECRKFGDEKLLQQARDLCYAIEELPAGEDQTKLILLASGVSHALQGLQRDGKYFWPQSVASECSAAPPTKDLREQIFEMMKHRQWSTHWIHRSVYLHLESAELAEAVRGKRGDTLDESADVLITMLALSPHALPEIITAATAKVASLMTKPKYAGETGTFGDVLAGADRSPDTKDAND
jgi:hypothetical protein